MKFLIVVDMQEDFINGALGNSECQKIVPAVAAKIAEYSVDEDAVTIFTFDTHDENYLDTLEGKKLLIKHCIYGTPGYELVNPIKELLVNGDGLVLEKNTFGSMDLPDTIQSLSLGKVESIELAGVCTDICVVSNALILRAAFPNVPISVDALCCAGISVDNHNAALKVMESCQIDVINLE